MNAFTQTELQRLQQFGEWLLAGLLLIFGWQYFGRIMEFVLTALHRIFIQHNPAVIK